jgi:DNA-binding NtrC family response regulator
MATLIADRFLVRRECSLPALAPGFNCCAVDLANGSRVRLRIDAAGNRSEQHAWIEERSHAHARGLVVDFGFLGKSQKFQAVQLGPRLIDVHAPATASVLDWLNIDRPSSPRILYLQDLPDPRSIRIQGFVPCALTLIANGSHAREVIPALASRSVAILDRIDTPSMLSLAVLLLRSAAIRELRVFVRRSVSALRRSQVAEGKATYDHRPVIDPRAREMVVDAERLAARGRHAAAERAFRAAMGAFDRRNDAARAAEAAMTLGRLLLSRGRAGDATHEFEKAQHQFQRVRAAAGAIEAAILLSVAQTDLQRFAEAERTCRAAHSAASALGRPDLTSAAAVALARIHVWQQRYGDARSLLESLPAVEDVEICTRQWCLHARLLIAVNALGDAWRAVRRARPDRGSSDAVEALVRTWEAAVQAKLGDVEALKVHVNAGLIAARAARWPSQAVRLRLTLAEGFIAAGKLSHARATARHLAHIRAGSIPPLLGRRIDAVTNALAGAATRSRPPANAAHETGACFQSPAFATTVDDLDGLRQLLSASHHLEDERDSLTRAVHAIARHTHAVGVGVFAYRKGDGDPLVQHGTCNTALATRSAEIGVAIRPEPIDGWVDAAVPVQYLGRSVGAVGVRWAIEGPDHVDRAMAFVAAAAAACAPLVYVEMERRAQPAADQPAFELVGVSSAMQEVRTAIRRAANAPFSVLIEGESGSGKELVARAVHRAGCRRERSFCALNCAAMPEDLIDAELFGHAKGAFTGAATERIGLFEAADGGSVFLDEVGELSARAQAKILRVLQEGEIRRIGETFTRSFDARLIAATNRSLRSEVEAGRFRQDLLYRLDVIRITVPPLRERAEDIPLLAAGFWRQCASRVGSKAVLGQSALAALARYDWPGNVRELQNVLAALVVAVPPRGVVAAPALPSAVARAAQPVPHESLDDARLRFEQRFVRAALARAAGHKGRTAAALGLSRQGLAKLLQRLQLDA